MMTTFAYDIRFVLIEQRASDSVAIPWVWLTRQIFEESLQTSTVLVKLASGNLSTKVN